MVFAVYEPMITQQARKGGSGNFALTGVDPKTVYADPTDFTAARIEPRCQLNQALVLNTGCMLETRGTWRLDQACSSVGCDGDWARTESSTNQNVGAFLLMP